MGNVLLLFMFLEEFARGARCHLFCTLMPKMMTCAICVDPLFDCFCLPGNVRVKICQYAHDTSVVVKLCTLCRCVARLSFVIILHSSSFAILCEWPLLVVHWSKFSCCLPNLELHWVLLPPFYRSVSVSHAVCEPSQALNAPAGKCPRTSNC